MQSPCSDDNGLGPELENFSFFFFAVVIVSICGWASSGGHLKRLIFQDSDASCASAFEKIAFRCFLLDLFDYFSRDILKLVTMRSEKKYFRYGTCRGAGAG